MGTIPTSVWYELCSPWPVGRGTDDYAPAQQHGLLQVKTQLWSAEGFMHNYHITKLSLSLAGDDTKGRSTVLLALTGLEAMKGSLPSRHGP